MCLILLAHRFHPEYPLILAANRDEFYDRPTVPAAFWKEAPQVLGGRDLAGGGTWLGVTRSGRLAAVANYRHPATSGSGGLSRGGLTVDFLRGSESPSVYLAAVARRGGQYKGFNLLVAERGEVGFYSNQEDVVRLLEPGLYGLSNALLDTPWPKVAGGREAFRSLLCSAEDPAPEALFALLADTTRPADALLPDTGVGLERERLLAPRFIVWSGYGTRSSTVILFHRSGRADFLERSFDRSPDRWREVRYRFRLEP